MENSAGNAEPRKEPIATGRRRIALESAVIEVNGLGLRRTGRFTDDSTRLVAMKWDGVRRVAAFQRDVMGCRRSEICLKSPIRK